MKYELVDFDKHTQLYRIRALEAIPSRGILPGHLGGTAGIFGDACVEGEKVITESVYLTTGTYIGSCKTPGGVFHSLANRNGVAWIESRGLSLSLASFVEIAQQHSYYGQYNKETLQEIIEMALEAKLRFD